MYVTKNRSCTHLYSKGVTKGETAFMREYMAVGLQFPLEVHRSDSIDLP